MVAHVSPGMPPASTRMSAVDAVRIVSANRAATPPPIELPANGEFRKPEFVVTAATKAAMPFCE